MDQLKIGRYVAEKRRIKGLTQKDMSEVLFVSDKAVSKWERGICLPNIELLAPLADILGVSVTELLAGEDESSGLIESKIIVDAVETYSTNNTKKMRIKTVGIAGVILAIMIIFVLLYAKYNVSNYDETARAAWNTVRSDIMDVLSAAEEIKENDYIIDTLQFYYLTVSVSKCLESTSKFRVYAPRWGNADSLSNETVQILNEGLDMIATSAYTYYANGGDCYKCSEEEISLISNSFKKLPPLVDAITIEMGIHSPSLAYIYSSQS